MTGAFLLSQIVCDIMALSKLLRQQIIIKRQERTEKSKPEKTAIKKTKKKSIFAPDEAEVVTDEL